MVVSCCCYGCDNTFVSGKVMSFFGFPKDKKNKDLWLKNIGIKGFVPTKHSRICVKHFTPDSYVFHESRRRMFLNKDAVPTIFNIRNKGGKKTQPQQLKKRSFAYINVNEETNKEEEELKPIAKGKTIEESCTKNLKIESTKRLGRPRKNVEKISSSIEAAQVCVDDLKKKKPYVFDKKAFVLEHMGPSYLPRVKSTKPPKVPIGKVKRYRYVLDFTADEMQNPEKAIRMLRMAKKKVQTQIAEIKIINEETTMLAAKRTSLQKLLRTLVKINENADTSTNEDLKLDEGMVCNSDVESDEHKMSDDDEDSCEDFDFEGDESDDFMFDDEGSDNDEEAQNDKISYEDAISSDLKSNLETLEDDQYYIIQIIEKDDCETYI